MSHSHSASWSGPALIGKLWLPLGLWFMWGVLFVVPIHDVRSAAAFAAISLPPILLGSFLFFIPGQLRSRDGHLMYRRWINWQTLPEAKISEIRRAFGLGVIRVASGGKLFFFIEPENRQLLGRGQMYFTSERSVTGGPHSQHRGALISNLILFIVGAAFGFMRILLTPGPLRTTTPFDSSHFEAHGVG